MFWGLIMEPQKRYSQVIRKPFHISMASLDLTNSDGQPAQVMCGYEGRNYLLCTLQKPNMLQCPLDLCFQESTTVSFATNGRSHVHLTGYLTSDLFDNEGEEGSEQEQFEVSAQKKTRGNDSTENQPSKKKAKKMETVDEEEDDSDDSDVDLEKLMNMGEEGLSEEESEDDEEVDDEEGSEEDDESMDEEGEDDDEDAEDETEVKGVAAMNGVSEKPKKLKKGTQATPKKEQQGKEKSPLKQTPGPKMKKQENGSTEELKKKGKEDKKPKENQTPNSKKKTLPGGVIVEDLCVGQGDAAGNGKFVHVFYEGRLKSNNKVFDKTNKGPGFGFRLGKGEVIKALDVGVAGMKVGGKRRITCPPHMAYGAKGSPPVIPPNSTLVFEVEIKKIK